MLKAAAVINLSELMAQYLYRKIENKKPKMIGKSRGSVWPKRCRSNCNTRDTLVYCLNVDHNPIGGASHCACKFHRLSTPSTR